MSGIVSSIYNTLTGASAEEQGECCRGGTNWWCREARARDRFFLAFLLHEQELRCPCRVAGRPSRG
eukprot:1028225-Prorocentrum_minimum.AAC.2